MLMFRELPCVYLHRAPVDFRKSINGLAVILDADALDAKDLYVAMTRGSKSLTIIGTGRYLPGK
jgi:DNA helicase IV